MTIETEFLKSSPYFAGLAVAELEAIRPHVTERKIGRGEIILHDGEPSEALYLVISGAVKVFKTSIEGKEQILKIVRPEESFNDAAILDSGANSASAQTLAPAVLYEIKKDAFKSLLQKHPQLAANTIKVLASQVRELVSLVEDLSFRHVIGRVAKILLSSADGSSPRPRLTQQDMAAIAGSAREVVGRSLKTLEEEGAIKLERHRIVITNKKKLEELVESAI